VDAGGRVNSAESKASRCPRGVLPRRAENITEPMGEFRLFEWGASAGNVKRVLTRRSSSEVREPNESGPTLSHSDKNVFLSERCTC